MATSNIVLVIHSGEFLPNTPKKTFHPSLALLDNEIRRRKICFRLKWIVGTLAFVLTRSRLESASRNHFSSYSSSPHFSLESIYELESETTARKRSTRRKEQQNRLSLIVCKFHRCLLPSRLTNFFLIFVLFRFN